MNSLSIVLNREETADLYKIIKNIIRYRFDNDGLNEFANDMCDKMSIIYNDRRSANSYLIVIKGREIDYLQKIFSYEYERKLTYSRGETDIALYHQIRKYLLNDDSSTYNPLFDTDPLL